ncbi:MAG: helix-turn-helix domain-containing protein [Syntrophomonas sp.]
MKSIKQRAILRELRGGRSLHSVATDLGITRQMLGAIELGDRNPSLNLAQKIADYYSVSIEDVFFENTRNETLPNFKHDKPTGTEG